MSGDAHTETIAQPRGIEILGVRIHDVTLRDALEGIAGFMSDPGKHQIAAVNPELIMRARTDPQFRAVLNGASLSLPDGIGVVHAARLLGNRIQGRVAGIDVVEGFAAVAADRGYSMFLLGGAEGVAEQAARVLRRSNPSLRIAGCHAGSPSLEEEEEIRGMINRARPDILFVAYGAPKQEMWIARNIELLDVRAAMSVGGTFDFIAGITNRAPAWCRRIGLEWLYRLLKEPRRWRRMLALPHFAALCVSEKLKFTS